MEIDRNAPLDFTCLQCSKAFNKTLREIEDSPGEGFLCPFCGASYKFNEPTITESSEEVFQKFRSKFKPF